MSSARTLGAEIRPLLRLAVPLAVAQGGQALMGLVDTAVVGHAGALPLAGVGLGLALFMAIAVLGMGVMHGVDPLVAQAIGAGDARRARRVLWQGTWLACGLAAILAIPFALAPALLVPFGVEPAVAEVAASYLRWRLPGLPFLLVFFGVRAYLQAVGTTRAIVVATAVANVANLGLDLLLVLGGAALPAALWPLTAIPAMGAAGAALATSVVSVLQVAVLARAVRAVPVPGGPVPRRADRRALAEAIRVGLPIGLHMAAEVGIFVLAGVLAARLGRVPLAAHQLATAVASLTFTVAVGVGNAGSVRVGWAVGARDRAAARRAGLAAFAVAAGFMAATAVVLFAVPGPIARLLTTDPAVVAAAIPLLRVAALFQISDGLQAVGAGVLRGAGATRFTFAANVVGHWALGFPAAVLLAFPAGLGVTGLWWGFVLGLSAVAAALVARFLRLSAREIVPLAERPAPARGRFEPSMRLLPPQPYEDLGHTADVGVRVRGASAPEALARLAVVLGMLLAGGEPGPAEREERIDARAPAGADLAAAAVALLRELLFRFATERLLPAGVEVHRVDGGGAEATVAFARYDPDRHGEGVDVKAVTWHAARLAPEDGGWVAQAVLDI